MTTNIAIFEALKIKAFRNLWLSQAISQVALNLLTFSLVIRVYEVSHSNTAVSLMVLATIVPNILFGALAGVLIDQSDRKVVMFFSHFLRIFAVLLFLLSSESLAWIYILTILINIITQFFFPAEAAMIHHTVSNKKLYLTANGLFSLTFFASVIVGNVLAGPSLQLLGVHGTLIFTSVAFVLAAFFIARIPGVSILKMFRNFSLKSFSSRRSTKETKADFLASFMEGLDHIYKTKQVRRGIFIMATGQVLVGILASIAPGFADQILKVAVTDVSVLVMAPAAVGMIIGSIVVGQWFRGYSFESVIKMGITAAAICLLAFSQADRVGVAMHIPITISAITILFLLGISNSLLDVPVNAMVQDNTPLSIRSRVYGVVSTAIGVAAIIPIILAGAIADIFGVRTVMMVASMAVFFVGMYLHELRGTFTFVLGRIKGLGEKKV